MLNDVHDSFFNVTSKGLEFYLQQTEKSPVIRFVMYTVSSWP